MTMAPFKALQLLVFSKQDITFILICTMWVNSNSCKLDGIEYTSKVCSYSFITLDLFTGGED